MSLFLAVLLACCVWHACWLTGRVLAARWLIGYEPLERICLSLVACAFSVHAVWMLGLILRVGGGGALFFALAACLTLMLASHAACARAGTAMLPEPAEVAVAFGLMAIPAWMTLVAATQSTLYGGDWSGDWYEHYRRALFFLGRIPAGEPLEFGVTNRPPLFNVLAAAGLAIVGTRFSEYQVVHLVWSCAAAIPCLLLLTRLTRRSFSAAPGLRLFLLAYLLQPMILANTLYTWTRMATAFFVLCAVYFYLVADREARPAALAWSFLAAGCGVVTHYSALVPVLMMSCHWIWRERAAVVSRRGAVALAAAAAPVLPWLVWAVPSFGWRATVADNTTAYNYTKSGLAVVEQWGYNLLTTVVPFCDWEGVRPFYWQKSAAGWWSDALSIYSASTIAGGVTTALIVACVAIRLCRLGSAELTGFRRGEARALLVAAAAAVLLSLPTIPNREAGGAAHLALQPAVMLAWLVGVAWIVAQGAGALRLFVALYAAQGLLYYWLKTFDRTAVPPDELGFSYAINVKIQTARQVSLLFDLDPLAAGVARIALLVGIVVLAVSCLSSERAE